MEIKSKSRDMRVKYFLLLFEALLYNLWLFFESGVGQPYFSSSAFVFAFYLVPSIGVLVDTVLEALEVEIENRGKLIQSAANHLGVSKALTGC